MDTGIVNELYHAPAAHAITGLSGLLAASPDESLPLLRSLHLRGAKTTGEGQECSKASGTHSDLL